MDASLIKISALCGQIQQQARRHNSLRPLAIEGLEELLDRFESILSAGSRSYNKNGRTAVKPSNRREPIPSRDSEYEIQNAASRSQVYAPQSGEETSWFMILLIDQSILAPVEPQWDVVYSNQDEGDLVEDEDSGDELFQGEYL